MTKRINRYSELLTLPTFLERFEYLKMRGKIGEDTFGYDRAFNQKFYTSQEWRMVRDYVMVRDLRCDLGIKDREIPSDQKVFIHHINPISLEDIREGSDLLLDPEFLITTTFDTHNAIHFGDKHLLATDPIVRRRNDTCPWKVS